MDSFPKNRHFIFGQRLAAHALDIMELLVEAAYARDKAALLHTANRKIEMLRWLVRMAKDRTLFTARQYDVSCEQLEECGRMRGRWLKQTAGRRWAELRSPPGSMSPAPAAGKEPAAGHGE